MIPPALSSTAGVGAALVGGIPSSGVWNAFSAHYAGLMGHYLDPAQLLATTQLPASPIQRLWVPGTARPTNTVTNETVVAPFLPPAKGTYAVPLIPESCFDSVASLETYWNYGLPTAAGFGTSVRSFFWSKLEHGTDVIPISPLRSTLGDYAGGLVSRSTPPVPPCPPLSSLNLTPPLVSQGLGNHGPRSRFSQQWDPVLDFNSDHRPSLDVAKQRLALLEWDSLFEAQFHHQSRYKSFQQSFILQVLTHNELQETSVSIWEEGLMHLQGKGVSFLSFSSSDGAAVSSSRGGG